MYTIPSVYLNLLNVVVVAPLLFYIACKEGNIQSDTATYLKLLSVVIFVYYAYELLINIGFLEKFGDLAYYPPRKEVVRMINNKFVASDGTNQTVAYANDPTNAIEVTWINEDAKDHTITIDGSYSTGFDASEQFNILVKAGQQYSHVFPYIRQAYEYRSILDEDMTGTLIVNPYPPAPCYDVLKYNKPAKDFMRY